ncbi:MAG: hypothetical protein WBX25_25085 [Rhodomicrobium sp.]
MRDFLISVASGFAVAMLSAIFLRRPLPNGRPSQNMNMNTASNGGVVRFLLVFLLVAVFVLAALLLAKDHNLSSWSLSAL